MTKEKSTGQTIAPLADETIAISHLLIPEVEVSAKWIRVEFAGETIADTKAALILRREKRLPVYCFPKQDVRLDLMTKTQITAAFPPQGTATYWNIEVGDTQAANAAWTFDDPVKERQNLQDYIVFEWGKMDTWREENDEVFVHLKDPYHRIDVLNSSRHVRVVAGGQTIANSHRAVFLFETGFPTRYYIPQDDVAMEFLEPSDLQTRCPYKGIASAYWSVKAGDTYLKNSVWCYGDPLPEALKVKDCLCFFGEKMDAIYLNETLVPKPVTPWS